MHRITGLSTIAFASLLISVLALVVSQPALTQAAIQSASSQVGKKLATPTPAPLQTPDVSACEIGRCVKKPVPFGEKIIIDGIEYQLLGFERPSKRIRGWRPKAGSHHVAFELIGRCITVSVFGNCFVSGLTFKATSSSHGLYRLAPGTLLMPGWIGQEQLLEGGELQGWVAYEVPVKDTNVQLVYDWMGEMVYFAAPAK